MSSEGTPLHGDRSAYNVMDFDTEHGKDIMDSTLRRHLPLPGAAGGIAQSDGTDWQRVSSLPLADLTDATRGCIIRRGATDWEAYDASTDGAALIGDGTDIISDLTPLWKGKHAFNDGFTFNANCDGSGTFDTNVECALAGGDTGLQSFIYQTDGTGMTGTLRGAYLTASGGNTANTGTIRGAEIKARAGRPGETGNNVAVLEGFSVSSDAKTYDVTTHRGGEIILDGGTGTSTLAVGLRIANNFQANRATTSYGLQIYRDSFDYTADIQLSYGHTVADGAGAITLNTNLSISGNVTVAGTVDGVDIAALKTDVDGFPDELKNLVTAEIQQLENIAATTISAAQWAYLGAFDQSLTQAASPTFAGLTLSGLGAGAVQSSAAGVISSGPLPLTDLASYTQGDLIYGGAADWQDLAHPGAANRVLQSTAAEIAWSANAVTFPVAGAVPTGTGANTQVAYWTAANTLSGAATFVYQTGASPNTFIQAANAAHTPLTVKGAAGQTAALQVWEDSAGTDLGWILHDGRLRIQYFPAPPAGATQAIFAYARATLTGNTAAVVKGMVGVAALAAGGFTIAELRGFEGAVQLNAGATGTVTLATGFQIGIADYSGAAATITTARGLYIGAITIGTAANYAIYAAGGNSYHAGRFAIGGTVAPLAQLHVDQPVVDAAIPVAIFDQADVDQDMFEFVTTIGVGNAIEAVGGKTLTTTHFIKVTLPGALTRYTPVGTIA